MSVTSGVITLLPAPEGYHVDFANPQRTGIPETYWVVGVGNAIALMFLVQRVYTKIALLRRVTWDDAFFILSWACCVTVQVLACYLYGSGLMGVHAWEIPIEKFSDFSLLVMVSSAVYAPGTCFAKLSLLCFYYQMTPIRWFRTATLAMVFLVVVGYLGIFFSLIFGCNPIQKTWDVTLEGTCINTAAVYIATAVLGVTSDLILLAMPIHIVLGLQLRTFQKAGLIFLFVVGSMTLVTSIVRLVLLFPMLVDFDQTWAVVEPFTWICIEANLLVVCASLSTIRRFALHVFPKLMSSTFGSSNGTPKKSERSDVTTFGGGSGRNHHKRYSKFNDSLYGLDTFRGETDIEVQGHQEEIGRAVSNGDGNDDADSAKAILKTRVTTVLIEPGARAHANPYHQRF